MISKNETFKNKYWHSDGKEVRKMKKSKKIQIRKHKSRVSKKYTNLLYFSQKNCASYFDLMSIAEIVPFFFYKWS